MPCVSGMVTFNSSIENWVTADGSLSSVGSGTTEAGRFDAFRSFWTCYRKRDEFSGLPLAAIRALHGACEERFTGFLQIRDDLEPASYLAVPFVYRSWNLLRLLVEEHPDTDVDDRADADSDAEDDRDAPGIFESMCVADHVPPWAGPNRTGCCIPVSWSITRALGLEEASARVNLGVLITVLLACGFIDPGRPGGVTRRSHCLVKYGSVGEFYRALAVRMFNRVPWVFDDGMPPLTVIQLNGLFLLYCLVARDSGGSAYDLACSLDTLCRVLDVTADPRFWIEDKRLIAAAIHSRFLARVGRMLGLLEPGPVTAENTCDPIRQLYRPTRHCRRTFCWQM